MNTCKTCKHWQIDRTYPSEFVNLAIQHRCDIKRTVSARREGDKFVFYEVESGTEGATEIYLPTTADFGCVLHEEKQ